MNKANKFEDILVWQRSKSLVLSIYKLFNNCRDYSFRDQIQRAAVSIMNNIAEGLERRGNKELSYFLYISKGSCGEVRSMIHIANELKYITKTESQTIENECLEISKMLYGFIKKINS